MLPKERRLRLDNDYKKLFTSSRPHYDKIFGFRAAPNGTSVSRFGFLVSNKVSKLAVERNRIKRRSRETVTKLLPDIKEGYDCVFVALAGANEKDYLEISSSIESHLRKSRLLKN